MFAGRGMHFEEVTPAMTDEIFVDSRSEEETTKW
jgi:hypothetical protein